MQLRWRTLWNSTQPPSATRRGVFLVITAICLAAVMTFVAFSVDMGIISLTKTRMQNATDSSALGAAMEITSAIENAGADVADVFVYAQAQAKAKAIQMASLNGVHVDESDIVFGRRYDDANGDYQYDWNPAGYQVNCVKVTAARDNPDTNAPNGQVPGLFTGMFKSTGTTVSTSSISYIEPRDIVVVHDFSRSMNFDSYFSSEVGTPLPNATIETNLQTVYDSLLPTGLGNMTYAPQYASQTLSNTGAWATVTYKGKIISVTANTAIKSVKLLFNSSGSQSQTFTISSNSTLSGSWQGTGGNSTKRVVKAEITIRRVGSTTQNWSLTAFSYDSNAVINHFSLGTFPYPGGSWSNYVNYVQTETALDGPGYRDMYGGKTFTCYVMRHCPSYSQCKDLWRTKHYPFHAIKEGHEMLCTFLEDLGFDDYVGMVSYDTSHRIEKSIVSDHAEIPSVDISANPLTSDYDSVNKLMKYKQAAHYSSSTNMAGGLKRSLELIDAHKRSGSRPAIILMTDGNSNTLDSGEDGALPSGWDWAALFDYDGNGSADYSTSSSQKTAVLKYVKQAVDKGYTVHAISVGNDADRDLLEAVAYLGNGYWVNVPGGMSASDMEDELEEAFIKIASDVPPARLVNPEAQ
jgi:Flp pilus assembly protein TadG